MTSLLDEIDDTELFLGLSILLQIIEAFGFAPMRTASFAVVCCVFPDSVATTFVKRLYILN